MTETTYASPRLERPRHSAFKGVCRAIARTTGTDPILWRVLTIGLIFFGGLGVLLYVVGIVAIPAEGQPTSLAERVIKGPDRRVSTGQSVLLALVVLMLAGFLLDDGADGLLVGAVVGGLALASWRERSTSAASRPAELPDLPPGEVVAAAPAVGPVPPVGWPSVPPRPRSPFGGLTVSAAVLVAGALLTGGAAGAADVSLEVVLAASLATVGIGLVAGSFFGRAPGLVLLAAVLATGLGVAAASRPVLEAGIGERRWTPTGSTSYRLGIGEATLDLTSLGSAEPAEISARVDVGHLLVIVPAGMRVSIDARAALGDVSLFGAEYDGRRVERHLEEGPPGAPPVRLDLSIRTGLVEVRRG